MSNEQGFIRMREYMAQFTADDPAPALHDHAEAVSRERGLERDFASLERHFDDATNLIYHAAVKVAAILEIAGCDGEGELFQDLAALEAWVVKTRDENARLTLVEYTQLEIGNKEYKRLQSAFETLQALKNHVRIWVGDTRFEVTIYDEQYITTSLIVSEGGTLLAACEGAIAQYRLWDREEVDNE